jgi:hypothetical protein
MEATAEAEDAGGTEVAVELPLVRQKAAAAVVEASVAVALVVDKGRVGGGAATVERATVVAAEGETARPAPTVEASADWVAAVTAARVAPQQRQLRLPPGTTRPRERLGERLGQRARRSHRPVGK